MVSGDIVSAIPALGSLDLAAQTQILRAGEVVALEPDTYLWRLDEPAERLHFLLAGRVHLRVRTAERRPLTITRPHPGDLLCGGAPWGGTPYCCEAYCVAPCRAFAVPTGLFKDLAGRSPALGLLRSLAGRSVHVCKRIPEIAGAPLDERLRQLLRRLAAERGSRLDSGGLHLSAVSREELAERCGVRTESVVRALSRLAASGWLRKEGPDLILLPPEGERPQP